MTMLWNLLVILSIATLFFSEVSFWDLSTGILVEKCYYVLVVERYQMK